MELQAKSDSLYAKNKWKLKKLESIWVPDLLWGERFCDLAVMGELCEYSLVAGFAGILAYYGAERWGISFGLK